MGGIRHWEYWCERERRGKYGREGGIGEGRMAEGRRRQFAILLVRWVRVLFLANGSVFGALVIFNES